MARDRIATGSRHVALGHFDDTLAGVVSWGITDELEVPALKLKSLYAAAHRGTGVASTLLDHAFGGSAAYLWVFENNPPAQAFYAKSGFGPDGQRKIDPDTELWEQWLTRTTRAPTQH